MSAHAIPSDQVSVVRYVAPDQVVHLPLELDFAANNNKVQNNNYRSYGYSYQPEFKPQGGGVGIQVFSPQNIQRTLSWAVYMTAGYDPDVALANENQTDITPLFWYHALAFDIQQTYIGLTQIPIQSQSLNRAKQFWFNSISDDGRSNLKQIWRSCAGYFPPRNFDWDGGILNQVATANLGVHAGNPPVAADFDLLASDDRPFRNAAADWPANDANNENNGLWISRLPEEWVPNEFTNQYPYYIRGSEGGYFFDENMRKYRRMFKSNNVVREFAYLTHMSTFDPLCENPTCRPPVTTFYRWQRGTPARNAFIYTPTTVSTNGGQKQVVAGAGNTYRGWQWTAAGVHAAIPAAWNISPRTMQLYMQEIKFRTDLETSINVILRQYGSSTSTIIQVDSLSMHSIEPNAITDTYVLIQNPGFIPACGYTGVRPNLATAVMPANVTQAPENTRYDYFAYGQMPFSTFTVEQTAPTWGKRDFIYPLGWPWNDPQTIHNLAPYQGILNVETMHRQMGAHSQWNPAPPFADLDFWDGFNWKLIQTNPPMGMEHALNYVNAIPAGVDPAGNPVAGVPLGPIQIWGSHAINPNTNGQYLSSLGIGTHDNLFIHIFSTMGIVDALSDTGTYTGQVKFTMAMPPVGCGMSVDTNLHFDTQVIITGNDNCQTSSTYGSG